MKIYQYLAIAIIVFCAGCIKDHGNYTYSTIDSVRISGIAASVNVDQFGYMDLAPALTFSGAEITDLAYEWKVNNILISTEKNCHGLVELTPSGSSGAPADYPGSLVVTNKSNNLKYYYNFRVVVQTTSTNALFILSEAANGDAKLSFQRRDKTNDSIKNNIFEGANPTLGVLGRKPVKMVTSPGGTLDATMHVLCKEGDRRVVAIDRVSMLMKSYYNASSTGLSLDPGTDFVPEDAYVHFYYGGFVLSGGRAYVYNYANSGSLGGPTPAQYNYKFITSNQSNVGDGFIAYEANTNTFGFLVESSSSNYTGFKPQASGVTPAGQFMAVGYGVPYSQIIYDPAAVFLNGTTANFYSLVVTAVNNKDFTTTLTLNSSLVQQFDNLITANSVCLLCPDRYWYLSNGNKIMRLFQLAGTSPETWFTLPSDKGNVVAMLMSGAIGTDAVRKLFVATYDGTNSYIFTISNTNAETQLADPMVVPGRIVSLARSGTWTY